VYPRGAYRNVQMGFRIVLFSGVPRIFFFERGSTNSFEDRGQRERGSRGDGPLVRGSTHFANE
jgi:hypothetical protein